MTTNSMELPYGFQVTEIDEPDDKSQRETKPSKPPEKLLRYSFYLNPPKIRVVTFKGGGARGFAYEKFIETIEENGTLEHVREVGGSSAGAIAAVFTAMHFEPGKRAPVLHKFDSANAMDLMGNSIPWKIYRGLSWPLYFISKPFGWVGSFVRWIGKQFNKIPYIGSLLGYPLLFASGLIHIPTILSPEGIAGIINLATGGGLYKGDKLQKSIRLAIQRHTKNGIEAILKKIKKTREKDKIIEHLLAINLLRRNNEGKLYLTNQITFNHFYHLARLPKSQFKELYITATALKDGSSVTLNRITKPDMSIHQAVRISMSIPYVYQHDGKYMDGGCADNFPIRRATLKKYDPFIEQFVDDRHARLGVRVDYHHELDHLWRKAKSTWVARQLNKMVRWLSKTLLGVDTYAADDEVTKAMNEDYAQRTISLYDHGIGLTEFDLSKDKREELNKSTATTVQTYFDQHLGEKAVVETYIQPTEQPLWQRFRRLNLLKATPAPNKEAEEKRAHETQEMERLAKFPIIKRHQLFANESQDFFELKKQAAEQRIPIKKLKNEISTDRLYISERVEVKQQRVSEPGNLRMQIIELQEEKLRLTTELNKVSNTLTSKEQRLSEIEKEIAELEKSHNALQDKIKQLDTQIPHSTMPLSTQVLFLSHLKNKNIASDKIFYNCQKTEIELDALRHREIKRFEQSPPIVYWNQTREVLEKPMTESKRERKTPLSLHEKGRAKFKQLAEQRVKMMEAISELEHDMKNKFLGYSKNWGEQEKIIQKHEKELKKPKINKEEKKSAPTSSYVYHPRM